MGGIERKSILTYITGEALILDLLLRLVVVIHAQ
jgi:hypothetical protein